MQKGMRAKDTSQQNITHHYIKAMSKLSPTLHVELIPTQRAHLPKREPGGNGKETTPSSIPFKSSCRHMSYYSHMNDGGCTNHGHQGSLIGPNEYLYQKLGTILLYYGYAYGSTWANQVWNLLRVELVAKAHGPYVVNLLNQTSIVEHYIARFLSENSH